MTIDHHIRQSRRRFGWTSPAAIVAARVPFRDVAEAERLDDGGRLIAVAEIEAIPGAREWTSAEFINRATPGVKLRRAES